MNPFAICHHAICTEEHQPHRTFHWRHCNVNNTFHNATKIHFTIQRSTRNNVQHTIPKITFKIWHDWNVLENCFFFNSKHWKKSNNEASEQPLNQPSHGGLSKTLHPLNHIRPKKETDKISKSVELSKSFFNNNLIAMFWHLHVRLLMFRRLICFSY